MKWDDIQARLDKLAAKGWTPPGLVTLDQLTKWLLEHEKKLPRRVPLKERKPDLWHKPPRGPRRRPGRKV